MSNSKKVLWENVRTLMVERYGRENLLRLAREAGVGEASVARIKEGRTSVGLDLIDAIAKVFRIAPHQLLIHVKDRESYTVISEPSFQTVIRAYNETDQRGREILEDNARILLERVDRARTKAVETK